MNSRISQRGAIAKTNPTKLTSFSSRSHKDPIKKQAGPASRVSTKGSGVKGKRKRQEEDDEVRTSSNSSNPTPLTPQGPGEEKRLRRWRSKPPQSFLVKLERARTQRMVVLGRRRLTLAGAAAEEIDIVGSTGNIYTVTVARVPTCTCPDALKGHECKHKVYALGTVLKAPLHLQYQLALLTSELDTIFRDAPPLPTDGSQSESEHGKRKPAVDDDECPICYMDLDEEHNALVWCRSQCGHNMHKSCFDRWAAASRTAGRQVCCVYCRTPWTWDAPDLDRVKTAAERTEDGYLNVASQFGLSRARDYSGYYQPWARRRFGLGW